MFILKLKREIEKVFVKHYAPNYMPDPIWDKSRRQWSSLISMPNIKASPQIHFLDFANKLAFNFSERGIILKLHG